MHQLVFADLAELLEARAVENLRLEFKREAPGPDETIKKLSSFANTFGGYMVVGAEAPSADGRLIALPGIDPLPNYKQTIIQRCASSIAPLIQPFVSDAIPVDNASGKVCYVVYVPESEEAPHFLNGRKGVYIRTDEFSDRYEPRLATADELLHLFDRRRLATERRESLVRRAAERFEQYAGKEYHDAPVPALHYPRSPDGVGATMHLALVPRFPVAPLLETASAVKIINDTQVVWRQSTFPGLNTYTPISQHESLLLAEKGEDFSLLEVNTWGLVSYAGEIQRIWTPPGGGGASTEIHLYSLLGHVLLVLEYARRIYDLFGYDGTLEVIVSLSRVRGVPVVSYPNNFREVKGSSRFDDDIQFSFSTSTDILRIDRDGVATDLLHTVLFALGWTHAAGGEEKKPVTADLLRGAYTYNFWKMASPPSSSGTAASGS